uniref:AAT12 n=1 Tax=Sinonovacula rivularis TaxID=489091 RepID=A0AA49XE13_9BIVA|nr:AAT12 [Sinonovacula rivularis]
MQESLVWQDYLTIGLYFILVLAVGIWSTCRPNKGSTVGYFLAGRNMHWIPIGASIYASNIGAKLFIGLTGTAAASGFAVAIYEWHAVFILIALGWIFVPVYVSCGAYTMPEYLRKRFGGQRIRVLASFINITIFILGNISAEIYCGAMFMEILLGWNIYLCVVIIIIVTAMYTITGGLVSVIYTDTLQTFILLGGAIYLAVKAFISVGGWDGLVTLYPTAAANMTLSNQTFYKCGMPRSDAFHIFRDPVKGDIPWPGAVIGLTMLGLYAWCQEQIIVQRCLSARSLSHAKAGALLAAFLKLFSFALFIIPGMISRILFPEEVACADPDTCWKICQNRAGCSNFAYPLLVMRLLPPGVRGLMLAALLAALMSSLTSIFNSASAIVTLDLWTRLRSRAQETELMVVGRVTVAVLLVVSILWLPILQQSQGGLLWFYIQAVKAYLLVPWCMVFLLGFFWKRLSEKGAFWGLIIGLVIGLIRLVLDFSTPAPRCGSGDPDKRFPVVSKVDFLHFAIILAVVSSVMMALISLCTKPRSESQLRRVTFWTRHAELEPELSDAEDEEVENVDVNKRPAIEMKNKEELLLENTDSNPDYSNAKQCIMNWLCGFSYKTKKIISAEEKAEIRRKMTSIKQNRFSGRILNIVAVTLSLLTIVLLVYFR